jgi:Xaa-Pro aminopeptidase
VSGPASIGSDLDRVERVGGELRAHELDALLVSAPVSLRYLLSFTGDHGVALLAAEGSRAGGPHRFLTDFRYQTQAAAQVPTDVTREIVAGNLLEAVAASLPSAGGRLAFEETSLSYADHARLREKLPPQWELVPSAGMLERLRAVKDAGEIERIRGAASLADEAMQGLLEAGLVHRTERELALELELRMRRLGAEAVSFPAIVAAGPHAALPHAEPRGVEVPADVLVTIDWGAVHEGYCSDCTRTYATGEGISSEARELYALVRSAQEAGLAAVRAGPTGREVDAMARAVIERAGQGEHFGHGLGHGVGLEVHEAPRLSRTAGERPLVAGNVVTVEPGVYLPGRLGIRIEDLVLVGAAGRELLSGLPKELTVV